MGFFGICIYFLNGQANLESFYCELWFSLLFCHTRTDHFLSAGGKLAEVTCSLVSFEDFSPVVWWKGFLQVVKRLSMGVYFFEARED